MPLGPMGRHHNRLSAEVNYGIIHPKVSLRQAGKTQLNSCSVNATAIGCTPLYKSAANRSAKKHTSTHTHTLSIINSTMQTDTFTVSTLGRARKEIIFTAGQFGCLPQNNEAVQESC